MKDEQLHELLYQALETEVGGIAVYETAIKCAVNEDLKKEWEEYLEQTQNHDAVLETLFGELGLDPSAETPGRAVVRHIGESLVTAMEMALASGPPEAAQLVAGESVVNAETKDHLNWELLRTVSEKATGPPPRRFRRPATRSRRRKTSTSTTPPAGPASCGWRRSACLQCCRHPRSRRA